MRRAAPFSSQSPHEEELHESGWPECEVEKLKWATMIARIDLATELYDQHPSRDIELAIKKTVTALVHLTKYEIAAMQFSQSGCLHFCYGFGGMVSPHEIQLAIKHLAKQFLTDELELDLEDPREKQERDRRNRKRWISRRRKSPRI